MMKRRLGQIFSQRKTAKWPSFKIVYEWEDILSESLEIPIYSDSELWKKFYRRFDKNGLTELYHRLVPVRDLRLDFVMTATTDGDCRNNKNTIPVIIDFWLSEKELPAFFKAYKHVPLMLVTNREVYDFLKRNDCPFPVEHWALSYPDRKLSVGNDRIEKIYDFCLFGRPDPFFERMRDEYAEKHPDFTFLITKGNEKNREYYTNKGEFICKDSGRQSYFDMMCKTKITCYSTPGMDESKRETVIFNQVTPRLFEMLSCGCHVMGHYPEDGADIQWYGLSSVVPCITNYDEFETCLDEILHRDVDVKGKEHFLSRHCTSLRCYSLKEILKKYDISIGI